MKLAFLSGIILGVVAVVVAAGFYPWIDHPRLPSHTEVLPNGGRAEQFVIRLPLDRILSAGTQDVGVRGRVYPDGVMIPKELASQPLLVEHFKVRDIEGNVIGVAARHTAAMKEGSSTVWSVTIPSRGTLRLAGAETPAALDVALRGAGRVVGEPWSGALRFTVNAAQDGAGRVTGGTGEFDGLLGGYSEVWLISGVGESGEVSGTIELLTTTFRAP